MEEFIARENVRRFEARLRASTDDREKSVIRELLGAEQRHLDDIVCRDPPTKGIYLFAATADLAKRSLPRS